MNNSDICVSRNTTTRVSGCDKKFFSNLTLVISNVKNLSVPINFIKGFRRATIIMLSNTKFQIIDALYYDASRKNLFSFEDILLEQPTFFLRGLIIPL